MIVHTYVLYLNSRMAFKETITNERKKEEKSIRLQ